MSESTFSWTDNVHNRPKRRNPSVMESEPPRKKARSLLEDDDASATSFDDAPGGALLSSESSSNVLTINQEFARRFEHNKRREELQKLEERYGKPGASSKRGLDASHSEGDTTESTDSDEEDDDGALALGDLDQQVQATLKAIKSKDPRVYDKNATFYTDSADQDNQRSTGKSKQKPMHLSDYHRRNIMQGVADIDEDADLPTYVQEQDELKATILQGMYASADAAGNHEQNQDEQDDNFLVPKITLKHGSNERTQVATVRDLPDVDSADKDPEKFLSDFMSARAWVPQAGSRFLPFESDDEEEEKRADELEEAYNLRFEDPNVLNEKLVSHARDAAARYSVRREEITGRKKAREMGRAKREAEKQEREEEKARLRKLRIANAEEKIQKIKEAAGLEENSLGINDWSKFLEEGWDTDHWEEEMRKRFGETYYEDQDIEGSAKTAGEIKRKIKKPKWKDDIAIDDLVPAFTEQEQSTKPPFSLSDIESDEREPSGSLSDSSKSMPTAPRLDKERKQDGKKASKKKARDERRQIEQLIDKSLTIDNKLADMGAKHAGRFRYRETSPINYGLTAQDILMASDSQLNQYAGLKKLATFRDSTKKSKDHKRLGKKARLREWRKETFGSEHGSQKTLAEVLAGQANGVSGPTTEKGGNLFESSRRKRRGKGRN